MTTFAIKITALLGALLLLLTAGFHMTAMGDLNTSLASMDSEFFKKGLPAMWVLPSAHWLFIACLSVGLSRYASNACAAILMAFGMWVLMDALIAFIHVGPFMGIYMLCTAGLLLLTSGVMLRKMMRARKVD